MSKLLITGATGQLGAAVIRFLQQKNSNADITALARDLKKAEPLKAKGVTIRFGDYNDPSSLEKAFEGMDKLYFVSGSDVGNRIKQHEHVIDAAVRAGVQHIIYTSFQRKNETETSPIYAVAASHLYTEEKLKKSGIPYTILKHNLYMDLLPMFIGENIIQTGTLVLPAGDGNAALTLRDDLAEAAAVILGENGHENKSYEFSNSESVSFQQIAKELSDITRKNIRYVSPAPEEYREQLTKAGVPDVYIGLNTAFATAIAENEFNFPDTTLEGILGRKPVTVREFLKNMYG